MGVHEDWFTARSPILIISAHFSCMLLRHNFPLFVYTVSLLYLRRWARHQSQDIFVQSSPHFRTMRSSKHTTINSKLTVHRHQTGIRLTPDPPPRSSRQERGQTTTKQFNYGKTLCGLPSGQMPDWLKVPNFYSPTTCRGFGQRQTMWQPLPRGWTI